MSDEKPPVTEGEKPQSPAVVKSATDTKAKPKRQPPAKPSGKTAATPVEKAVENAVEIKLETRVENPRPKWKLRKWTLLMMPSRFLAGWTERLRQWAWKRHCRARLRRMTWGA